MTGWLAWDMIGWWTWGISLGLRRPCQYGCWKNSILGKWVNTWYILIYRSYEYMKYPYTFLGSDSTVTSECRCSQRNAVWKQVEVSVHVDFPKAVNNVHRAARGSCALGRRVFGKWNIIWYTTGINWAYPIVTRCKFGYWCDEPKTTATKKSPFDAYKSNEEVAYH